MKVIAHTILLLCGRGIVNEVLLLGEVMVDVM